MDLHLAKKIIIVTGGGAGIGGAISLTLAAEGAIPVIVGRSDLTAKFVEQLTSITGNYGFFRAELSDESACQKAVAYTLNTFGRLDGLVNNAGTNDNVGLSSSVQAFRHSLESNLTHYFTMMHYALPHLKASKGSVVNIGSKVAWTGQGQTSGYAAANGGRLALTREWAAALLGDGIRVNMIVPAEVMTPLYQRWIDGFADSEKKLDEMTANIPLGKRMTMPQEIADNVVFLLSNKASHTTGQWVFVDGGYTHLDSAISPD
ncbi:MAG: L-fucose dehydrogenase [Ostreibacterium sp.]